MNVTVNGLPQDYTGDPALLAFLRKQGADPDRVAVLVNEEIVPRLERDGRTLCEGDRVEILIFAGGG